MLTLLFYFVVLAKQQVLEHPIKHQILYYHIVDNDSTTESYKKFSKGFYFTKKMADYFLKCYAPDKGFEDILLFPNKASTEDLVGLPPAFLVTCEADILRDEGESYGRKLRVANVSVSSIRVNGVLYGFVSCPPLFSDESYHTIDMTKTVLQKAFNVGN
ncbi:alpha/beta hydrolase fold-domain-containing protein [Parasitella parasitica]|nr:alpha/beta hydrolase fold-domain-containing protein [Parasitella parasitica]